MDLKDVIEGLEHCRIGDCAGCPYDNIREETLHGKFDQWRLVCNEQLTVDIITLLKEKYAKRGHWIGPECSCCHAILEKPWKFDYCPYCGAEMKSDF